MTSNYKSINGLITPLLKLELLWSTHLSRISFLRNTSLQTIKGLWCPIALLCNWNLKSHISKQNCVSQEDSEIVFSGNSCILNCPVLLTYTQSSLITTFFFSNIHYMLTTQKQTYCGMGFPFKGKWQWHMGRYHRKRNMAQGWGWRWTRSSSTSPHSSSDALCAGGYPTAKTSDVIS
jgi:hypothetical protein